LKNCFDVLLEEGREGNPKMMSIGLHCRLVGKPGRAAGLKKFLEYVSQHPDVWVATREEIAIHWRKNFPFGK
jgi:peptidoglycan/xylan/chitin deacetylase (PgdA/CDA1 family)